MNATKPGIIGWNLIKLAYNELQKTYGKQSFDNFNFPTGVSLLLFSQLCAFHHDKVGRIQLDSIAINGQEQQFKNNAQQFLINEDGLLGKIWIGNTSQPICVPDNAAITIPGRLGRNIKIPSGTPCLVDTTAVHNLPQGYFCQLLPCPSKRQCGAGHWDESKQLQCLDLATIIGSRNFLLKHLPWDYGVEFHQGGRK